MTLATNLGINRSSNLGYTMSGNNGLDGGGGFLPPLLSGLLAWYETSKSSSLTLSTTAITQFLDLSGNGNDTNVQATSTARPTWTAAQQNGLSTAVLDGGDLLAFPSELYSLANGDNTVFAVAKRTVDSGNQMIFSMNIGVSPVNDSYKLLFGNTAGTILFQNVSSNAAAVTSSGNTTTDYNVITCYRSGTTQSISVNGGTESTNTNAISVATIDGGAIGAQDEGALFLTGGIAELIFYNRKLTAVEIAQVESYLTNKWGTP